MKTSDLINVDFELAAKQAGGMYMLVIKTAALQRDLRRQRDASGSSDVSKTGVVALRMIQTGERV
jgi:hypothetical protein